MNDSTSSYGEVHDGNNFEANSDDVLVIRQFAPAMDVQALLRIAGAPHCVENVSYPNFASTGELPQLQHGRYLASKNKIFEYVSRLADYELDFVFGEATMAQISAFSALVDGPLNDALEYSKYVIDDSYTKLCQKAMTAPLCFVLPGVLRRKKIRYLHTRGISDSLWARHLALSCYKSLSELLQEKDYFFGTTPTSLDAKVFGHCYYALRLPLLRDTIQKFENLIKHHDRIIHRYFPDKLSCIQGATETLTDDEIVPATNPNMHINEIGTNVFELEWYAATKTSTESKSFLQYTERWLPTAFFLTFLTLGVVLTRRAMTYTKE